MGEVHGGGGLTPARGTLVVSLFGGPGCGKSTLAAGAYHALKQSGADVELVREYVKAWAYRGTPIRSQDELYVLAKQIRAEHDVLGKVAVLITDRPIAMSAVYDEFYTTRNPAIQSAIAHEWQCRYAAGHRELNLMVKRTKPYVTSGRFEDEEAAVYLDQLTEAMFDGLISVETVDDVLRAIKEHNV